MSNRSPGQGAKIALALAAVYLVWGSTYLALRYVAIGGLPPLVAGGLRFITSGLLLGGILAVRDRRAGRPLALRVTRAQLWRLAAIGTLMIGIGNGGVALAELKVTSGLAALLISITPIWVALFGLATGERGSWLSWLGTMIGFSGTAVLARPGGSGAGGAGAWWAIGLILAASISWAVGSVVATRSDLPTDPFVGAAYQMLLGGSASLLVGLTTSLAGTGLGGPTLAEVRLSAVPASAFIGLAYLTVVGGLVAYTSYYWLLRHAPLQLVATYGYVNPVVAVLLGWIALSEPISATEVIGGGLALAGVALIITARRPPAAKNESLGAEELSRS